MLISSGSRLDQDLLISLRDSSQITMLQERLKQTETLSGMRITSYTDRSERNFETTQELTDYIVLIILVAAIFAGIILRSAHDGLFADLSRTFRIVEILGFSRKRQMQLFMLLYTLFIPTAYGIALGASYIFIKWMRTIEGAEDFVFQYSSL
jgi:predicted lysophospholipase L1 biosynthesis ABC-type transport system permease subunit